MIFFTIIIYTFATFGQNYIVLGSCFQIHGYFKMAYQKWNMLKIETSFVFPQIFT